MKLRKKKFKEKQGLFTTINKTEPASFSALLFWLLFFIIRFPF
jgi:hypothetical protein